MSNSSYAFLFISFRKQIKQIVSKIPDEKHLDLNLINTENLSATIPEWLSLFECYVAFEAM